ncbi:alpha/beta hydrolase [Gordonia sp. ABSL1-1]|uniref:alpha/beta hydrolase n=1 Tax=Gordonia sp. ABSL1-1 TaxID=3053923 RepID=UPI002572F3A8|nr:alpha/beta hydrolase [Gordonia sp. ABSL1-1]MDL9935859.1 alpha/beta hydrolase [Gordonia sp. ABSL1-1]
MDLSTVDGWDIDGLEELVMASAEEDSAGVAERLAHCFGLAVSAKSGAAASGEAGDLGRRPLHRVAAESLSVAQHLRAELAEIRIAAEAAGMTVHPDAAVTALPRSVADDAAREHERSRLEYAAMAVGTQADTLLDTLRVSLVDAGHDAAPQVSADVDAAATAMVPPSGPPSGISAEQNAAYWYALTDAQRDWVLTEHPEWIGGLDGIPSPVRDRANRSRIPGVLAGLELTRDRLSGELSRRRTRGWFTNQDAGLAQVERKIADVRRLGELVAEKPWSPADRAGTLLLLLDTDSGEQGKAVVAVGNPDDADHVGISTPGMDTNIRDSFRGMIAEAASLRDEGYRQLREAGRFDEQIAIVGWLGYEPPDNAGTRPPGWSYLEVLQHDRATSGAPALARFYRGLAVASTRTDPHLVALGHSYGSLTQGLALKQPGGHPIDDAVFYGSPGFMASDEPDLGLAQGHGFVMQGDRDWINHVRSRGRIGLNGPAPRSTQLVQLDCSTARFTPDGVYREGAHTHADYPRNGSNHQLRVSGYLLARIVAGLDPRG